MRMIIEGISNNRMMVLKREYENMN
jgi:hypothetical protein